jgi:hypothetical protein
MLSCLWGVRTARARGAGVRACGRGLVRSPVLVVEVRAVKFHDVDTRSRRLRVADGVAVARSGEHAAGQAGNTVAFVHLPDSGADSVLGKGQEHALDGNLLPALVLHDLRHVLALAELANARRDWTKIGG